MIQLKTVLKVIDNTGASLAECIRVVGKGKQHGSLGDEIVVVIKELKFVNQTSNSTNANTQALAKIQKGDVRRAVIVRTRKEVERQDGRFIKFDDNACVLLNYTRQPLGSRVLGVVANELRYKNWGKVLSIASKVV